MSVALSEMTDGNESEITPHLLYSALYVPPSILFVWLVYTNINIFHHITGNVTILRKEEKWWKAMAC